MRRGVSLILFSVCAGLMGCSDDLPRGATSILQVFAQPTPAQAAEWAIDKYDADKRYRGTLILANQPFGGEPVYMELYLDNIKDPDASVRGAATRAIANHGRPDQVPLLVERLKDEDRLVRQEAARGLQRLHNPVAINPLIAAIDENKETDVDVRAEAAHALGQYADNKVVQALIAALNDSNLAVNRNTLLSLRTLTGQDFGYDRRAWIDWYDSTKDTFAARGVYTYPAFHRDKNLSEYIPFVPPPPNEPTAVPVGLPGPQGQ
ncbi:MAG: HEAT repeat domain-containing protein [Phycisphaerales bacterium]|nr:HEAT repeat domain-containing protein [Phycisphaerales bacterium]